MLLALHIENIAVIEQADINFDGGFNVLTGETGAGNTRQEALGTIPVLAQAIEELLEMG